MPKKKKNLDPKLVSKQKHEIAYIRKRHKIPVATIKEAMKLAGRGRAKIYAKLREWGFEIKTRKHK